MEISDAVSYALKKSGNDPTDCGRCPFVLNRANLRIIRNGDIDHGNQILP